MATRVLRRKGPLSCTMVSLLGCTSLKEGQLLTGWKKANPGVAGR
jgi:hypothetical protein